MNDLGRATKITRFPNNYGSLFLHEFRHVKNELWEKRCYVCIKYAFMNVQYLGIDQDTIRQ